MSTTTVRSGRRSSNVAESGTDVHKFARTLKDARAGLIEAQYQAGLMYANGAGTPRDMSQAITWITRAAERGHVAAQFMLGTHYGAEPGTAPSSQVDEAQALDWLFRATKQDHARAHHRLARLLAQSHETLAAAHEAMAASLGVAESQLALALASLHCDDEPEIQAGAVAWLQRAAAQSLPAAQAELGKAYLEGRGVPVDPDEGLRWLRRAAQRQWPAALIALHARGAAAAGPEGRDGAAARTATAPRSAGRAASPGAPESAGGAQAAVPLSPPPDPVDAQARHDLGLIWELGIAGLKRDLQQARHWYALAAQQGLPAARAALGRLAEGQDVDTAIAHYRIAATAADADAQAALGRLLGDKGRTAQLQLEARCWTARAAQSGHPQALLALAEQCQASEPEVATEALRRAAGAGLAEAQFRYASQLVRVRGRAASEEAFEWNQRAAEQGHAGALCALGLAYRTGDGVARDPVAARRHLREAADKGDNCARWNLALLLATGTPEAARDMTEAMALCREAADAGFVPARATMGVLCTAVGRPDEALRWWSQAAVDGDVEAEYNLALAYAAGRGAPENLHRAFDHCLNAAEAGLALAQARIGILYASGQGVAADPIEAHKWFFVAKLAGDKDAARNVQRSRELLSPEAREEGERRARAWRVRRR
jgi:TPR repeat protein